MTVNILPKQTIEMTRGTTFHSLATAALKKQLEEDPGAVYRSRGTLHI